MAQAGEVFVCDRCGNAVVVMKSGGNPDITCCGENMRKVEIGL